MDSKNNKPRCLVWIIQPVIVENSLPYCHYIDVIITQQFMLFHYSAITFYIDEIKAKRNITV